MASAVCRNVWKNCCRFLTNDLRLQRCLCTKGTGDKQEKLDEKLLEILVCPFSKKPLRYNEETNELVNDELGVAYPIVNGIPNLVPQDGRIINKDDHEDKTNNA